jgi:hypothetical protein
VTVTIVTRRRLFVLLLGLFGLNLRLEAGTSQLRVDTWFLKVFRDQHVFVVADQREVVFTFIIVIVFAVAVLTNKLQAMRGGSTRSSWAKRATTG